MFPQVAFTYSYDPLGRLDAVKDKLGDVIQKNEYNAIGQLVQAHFGKAGANRVLIDYAYHFRGWLKKIHAVNQAGATLFNQDLKYEDGATPKFNGNISEYNYAIYTSGVKNYSFGYDELDRLVSAVTTNTEADPNDNGQFNYTYYPNGTINTTTRKSQTFTYNYTAATNQLNHVTYTGTSPRDTRNLDNFVYDLSGRMVVDESKQMDLRYDNFNDRPVQFNQGTPSGNVASYMVYDAGGNRVSKMEYVNGVRQEAKHYFGNGKEIREYPAAATVEVYPLDSFGRIIKNGVNWESEVYVKNNLGSTVAVHNITRDAQAYRTDYEPYGKLKLEVLTSAVGVTNQFTGKEFEARIGLYNFGARWYDPELGIWISTDPKRQFFNTYGYGANPINGVDPDGNKFETDDFRTESGQNQIFQFLDCALLCSPENKQIMFDLQDAPETFRFGLIDPGANPDAIGAFVFDKLAYYFKPGGLNAETFAHENWHAYRSVVLKDRSGERTMTDEVAGYKHGFKEVHRLGAGQKVSQPGAYGLWQRGKSDYEIGDQLWWSSYRKNPIYKNDFDK